MLRCSECKYFCDKYVGDKTFHYCFMQLMEKARNKDLRKCKLWDKAPKAHPRWCPLWRKDNAESREH